MTSSLEGARHPAGGGPGTKICEVAYMRSRLNMYSNARAAKQAQLRLLSLSPTEGPIASALRARWTDVRLAQAVPNGSNLHRANHQVAERPRAPSHWFGLLGYVATNERTGIIGYAIQPRHLAEGPASGGPLQLGNRRIRRTA